MKFKEIETRNLIEHPENAKLFRDIKDTDPAFWREFVDSIKTFGVIEPLIVNQDTMQVRSGNQRLKAAIEIGLEMLPVILVDPETDSDEEIRRMIASNVFRRTINPFAMFEYIGRLRNPVKTGKSKAQDAIAADLHKSNRFVSAAAIYKSWTPEQKAAIDEWYEQKTEGRMAGKEGELIAMIKAAEAKHEEAQGEIENYQDQISALDQEIEEARSERAEIEKEAGELKTKIDSMEDQIEEIQATDYEQEKAVTDRTINDLLEKQAKLREQLRALKEKPDINYYLIDCAKKQREINAVLKELIQAHGALSGAKLHEFRGSVEQTIATIKRYTEDTNETGQNDRKEITDDRD